MNNQQLHKLGIRVTKHTTLILQLFNQHNHLDANQIHQFLTNSGIRISLSTIYRVLLKFVQYNLITKHNFKDHQGTYELVQENKHHDHLICIKCNIMIEFVNCQIESLQQYIAEKNNFIILTHQLNLYGLCATCANSTTETT